MEYKKLDGLPRKIGGSETVTFKTCGRVLSAVYCSSRGSGCNIKKLTKETFVNLNTGELKNFKHNTSRVDNIATIKKSLANLRDYINTNCTNPRNCKWITLTYAENMTDTKRLYLDFNKFVKRFHYEVGEFEYIVAVEPQGRGAWHAHLLVIFPGVAPYVANSKLAQIWGNGFVKVNKLDNIDNVGAYLTAYLGDMELNKANSVLIPEKTLEGLQVVTRAKKSIIKGGRLYLYPLGFNLYRCSRGIQPPTVEKITESELQSRVSTAKTTYTKIIRLTDEVTKASFWVYYRYYLLPQNNIKKGSIKNEKVHFRNLA